MSTKNLFKEVLNCNDEYELHKIVTSNELLNNPKNWHPYGDNKANFGTFENQQSNSSSALIEKVTNSIDALLLKECKLRQIDPKSDKAPNSIEDATEKFYGIPKGDIGELLKAKRAQMARDNIQIIATGNSNLMIWDNGEGQHPDDFKNTFLSIANGNKTDIQFVQGKYNMGSTGAVVYCGKYRYQMIASKKNKSIFDLENKHKENLFGWTLVRRHILDKEESKKCRSTWYEYFAINGEHIPSFEIDELNIGLFENQSFKTGSFVKLYSYEMPRGSKGAITSDLSREINQLLYKSALPIWLYEGRTKYSKLKKQSIAVYGNHVRINSDNQRENLEVKPFYEKKQNSEYGELIVQAVVFKKGDNNQQHIDRVRNFIGKRNVVYTLNGQVQGTQGVSFITQCLQYNFLKETMLVIVDCSKINTEFRQDLFMANRTNLREGDKLDFLRSEVINILKNNDKLRELNNIRKDSILQGGDDKKEKELLESLLSKIPLNDKSLVDLLKKGTGKVNLPHKKKKSNDKGKNEKQPLETKRFPSIFKMNLKEYGENGKKVKSIPLNGKGIIQFETDVAEDYFYRPLEKGDFQIQIMGGKRNNDTDNPNPDSSDKPTNIEDIFEVCVSGPNDGSIKLTLNPKSELSVGEEIEINARLTSPDGDMENIFYVKIADPQKNELKPKSHKPENPQLPKIIKITKSEENGNWVQDNGKNWNEVNGWDENSIVHIIPNDNENQEKIIGGVAINMHSNALKKYISKNNSKNEKKLKILKNRYLSKVYLHSLFLYSILDKINNNLENSKDQQDSGELTSKIFKNYCDVLIYIDTNKEILESIGDE